MSACVNCELDHIAGSSNGNTSRVHLEPGTVNATYLAIGWMSVVASARVTESSMMNLSLRSSKALYCRMVDGLGGGYQASKYELCQCVN